MWFLGFSEPTFEHRCRLQRRGSTEGNRRRYSSPQLAVRPLSVISQRYAVVQLGSLQLDGQGRLAQVQSGGLGQKAHTPIDPMIQRLLPVEGIALAF